MKNTCSLTSPIILITLLLGTFTVTSGEPRTWKNRAGKTITAELLSTTGEDVTLKLENGQKYTIPVDSLSVEDGQFIREWKAEKESVKSAPKPSTEPLMTVPGKLIFSADLGELDNEWKKPFGDWTAGDGALTGAERAADDHGAVLKRGLPVKNVIVEYEVMLGDAKNTSFSMDDTKDHVCRVSITPAGFHAQKDDNDHEGPDVSKPFNRVATEIDSGEWQTVRIEILGEEMLAQLGDEDENISLGSDPLIGTEKAKWGFTVSGQSVNLKNLKIWEALPNEEWEKVSRRLKRKLDIED